MPEAITVQQRIIPGAPPSAPLSKMQKKKRKAKAKTGGENGTDGNNIDNIDRADSPATSVPDAGAVALIEKAHDDATDVQKGLLTLDLAVQPEPHTPTIPDELKPNTIAGLVNKRLKATTKKITRITVYAATDPEKLDDDQKRILKSLPILEAIQKELGEVKKVVEVYEADFAQEFVAKKLEAEKAERVKLAEAVSASQNESVQKIADILDLLRLRSLLDAGEVDTLPVDEQESSTLLSVADTLLGNEQEKRLALIRGLLLGAEEFNGISYARLTEITQLGLAPPRAPTPIAEPAVEQPEAEIEPETTPAVTTDLVPEVVPVSKGFSFVQESEIDEARPAADDDEWVDASVIPETQAPEGELTNGHVQQEVPTEVQTPKSAPPVFVVPATSAPLDWATDDTDLPPIADVQESIGASVTPVEVQLNAKGEENTGENSPLGNRRPEEEGFIHSGNGRGRGRGPRGERGGYRNRGERGGFRGERGSFRGGDRGGFRGERGGPHGGEHGGFHGGERGGFHGGERGGFHGGERGGFRGERGGFRGGEHGGHRGGERGEPQGGDRGEFRGGYRGRGEGREGRGGYRGRGEWRGDGEHRGGGDWRRGDSEHRGRRGRGRGFGDRGAPAATTPVAAEPAA